MNETTDEFLIRTYNEAMEKASGSDKVRGSVKEKKLREHLDTIIKNAEGSKAVLAVLLTSIVYKIEHPEQDIRLHQKSIEGGYSGRTFDSQHITPFLRAHRFPAMEESGWLTRSLEQKYPYTLDYQGAIRNVKVKEAFLRILHSIEEEQADCAAMLDYSA